LAGNKWRTSAEQHPLDGESFAHVLRNPSTKEKRDPVFYLFPGYMDSRAEPTVVAIDDLGANKRFKLYYYYESDAWELYCLSDDPGELKNLVESEQEIASMLSRKIHAWLTQQHPTWRPKYPIEKSSGRSAGPPPML